MSDDRMISTIERAFQLARAGVCHSVEDIRAQLSAERYDRVYEHLSGSTIQRQLRALLISRGVRRSRIDDDGDTS
jgi:hypothetical protein